MAPVAEVAGLDCLVLAGGLGTRLRGLFPDLPKPLAPVAGRPFMEWTLRALAAEGVSRVCISAGYKAERIVDALGDGARLGIGVALTYALEESPLGTAGAIRHARRALEGERVLVVNADSLVLFDLAAMLAAHRSRDAAGSILAVGLDDTARYGRLESEPDGRLRSFGEKAKAGPGEINAGVYLLERRLVDAIPEGAPLSLERDMIPAWIMAGERLFASPGAGPFVDMGTPEGHAAAEELLRGPVGARLEGNAGGLA